MDARLTAYARAGAEARMKELEAEIAQIRRDLAAMTFNASIPGVRRKRATLVQPDEQPAEHTARKGHHKLNAAQRAEISRRMKALWKARRREAKKKASK